ncbi:WEB family protein At2g17940 [Lactuca sativa]|uniref:WEB family protein At2g17940 n=1 Tax=Lactuca sativa TaxID=4236 RepID=UPI000CB71EB3|nr:WEB family protein At2g17940 [Lactuca sativa]
MESQTLPENPPPPPIAVDYSSNVDTSRAFSSVKEAVAIFGEKFLTGEIFLPSPKPPFTLPKQETPSWKSTHSTQTSWKSCSSSSREIEEEPPPPPPVPVLVTSLKKLESELEETKKELKLLKEKESETEVALASLNAELQKNMSKIAKAEKVVEQSSMSGLTPVVSSGGGRKMTERKVVKKKPIIPLLGDLFSKKKGKSNSSMLNPLYTSSQMHWN